MFDQIMEYLRELNIVSISVRFLLAIICGGAIGIERGKRGQAAGFRTHILVCIGAAISMLTGQYISEAFQFASDPSRLGAQVISGIGFLGVGTIIITQSNKVRGLTTAAGLWASACIGISIGIGFYEAAIIGTILVVLTVVALQKIDGLFYGNDAIVELYLELEGVSCIKTLIATIKENNLRVTTLEMHKSKYGDDKAVGVVVVIKNPVRKSDTNIFEAVSQSQGVLYIEEIN